MAYLSSDTVKKPFAKMILMNDAEFYFSKHRAIKKNYVEFEAFL
jgi:hypothetical protein